MSLAPILIPLLSFITAFAAFYFATRASLASSQAGIHAVDAEAYTRASGIYEDTIANLRADIDALRIELKEARREIRELRNSNDAMAIELRTLGKVISEDEN